MLLEFTVANYRSIRDSQTLSMIASVKDEPLAGNAVALTAPGLETTRALSMAAVYGPNASGKTNVLKALLFMKSFIESSARYLEEGEATGVEPFLFDADSKRKPSSFDIVLALDGVRFDYGFELDSARVIREYLHAYPKGRRQTWFERNHKSNGTDEWSFSRTNFKIDREVTRLVRPNALLLSVAAQFNHEQSALVYRWFSRRLRFLNLSGKDNMSPTVTGRMIERDSGFEREVVDFLAEADIPIAGARVKRSPFDLSGMTGPAKSLLNILVDEKGVDVDTPQMMEVKLVHRCADGHEELLDLEEESAGTHRMFSVAGPWLDTLKNGYTLVVDELDTSLHPDLARALCRLITRESSNPNHAQLIFTTHNVQLLDRDVLRRDAVWFTEADECGATELYPMTEFKPRPSEAFGRGYMAGRYGALPELSGNLKDPS